MINILLQTWQLLRYTYAILFVLVGCDKFYNYLCHWRQYISPYLLCYESVWPEPAMYMFGAAQIIAGLLLFSRWIKKGIIFQIVLLIGILFSLLTIPNQHVVTMHAIMMIVLLLVLYSLTNVVLDFRKTN